MQDLNQKVAHKAGMCFSRLFLLGAALIPLLLKHAVQSSPKAYPPHVTIEHSDHNMAIEGSGEWLFESVDIPLPCIN